MAAATETHVLEQAVQLLLQRGNDLFSCPLVVRALEPVQVEEGCQKRDDDVVATTPFNSPVVGEKVTGEPDSDPNPFGADKTVLEKDGLDDDFFELV